MVGRTRREMPDRNCKPCRETEPEDLMGRKFPPAEPSKNSRNFKVLQDDVNAWSPMALAQRCRTLRRSRLSLSSGCR